jgi:hypothetical protein
MTKHPSESSIIEQFATVHSIEWVLGHFRRLGTPTTADHIVKVWKTAQAANILPPGDRPPDGFDFDHVVIMRSLVESAHGKTRSEHAGSSV